MTSDGHTEPSRTLFGLPRACHDRTHPEALTLVFQPKFKLKAGKKKRRNVSREYKTSLDPGLLPSIQLTHEGSETETNPRGPEGGTDGQDGAEGESDSGRHGRDPVRGGCHGPHRTPDRALPVKRTSSTVGRTQTFTVAYDPVTDRVPEARTRSSSVTPQGARRSGGRGRRATE